MKLMPSGIMAFTGQDLAKEFRYTYHNIAQYAIEQGNDSQPILDKPKRQFCKRTKTGCLTCRKRRKKCDEYKPQCEFTYSGSEIMLTSLLVTIARLADISAVVTHLYQTIVLLSEEERPRPRLRSR
jgi:hypothetical protein